MSLSSCYVDISSILADVGQSLEGTIAFWHRPVGATIITSNLTSEYVDSAATTNPTGDWTFYAAATDYSTRTQMGDSYNFTYVPTLPIYNRYVWTPTVPSVNLLPISAGFYMLYQPSLSHPQLPQES